MEKELFADVKSEGAALDIDKAFERLETKGEESSESQPEMKTESPSRQGEKNTDSEEKIPFHKHPRWQKTQQELKETREKLLKLESERGQTGQVKLPDWWKNQYGDTEESKQRYQLVTQKDGELDWLKQNILNEIDNRTQAEQSVAKEGEEYVDVQLAEMSDEGLEFDRNSLLKFMVDFQEEFGAGSLLDTEGNYDFRKSLKLMAKMAEEEADDTVETKKALAGQAGRAKSSAPSTSKVPVLSRRTLRGKGGWRDAGL